MSISQQRTALGLAEERKADMHAILHTVSTVGQRAGQARVAHLLRSGPDEALDRLRVRRLLKAISRRGDQWADRVMAHAGVRDMRIGKLPPTQRRALADAVLLPFGELRASSAGQMVVRAEWHVNRAVVDEAARALLPYVAPHMTHVVARAALQAAVDAGRRS